MPPSANSLTYGELKLRVASRAGLVKQDATTGKMVAHTTEPAATRLEMAVRDAASEFMVSHDWSFATVTLAITLKPDGDGALNINGDPSRYLLPQAVACLADGICYYYGPDDNTGDQVAVRHPQEVGLRYAQNPDHTGLPEVVSAEFNPLLRSSIGQEGGVELRVFPEPDLEYELEFRCRIGHPLFITDDQRGFWPAVHDLTIVDLALVHLFLSDRSAADAGQEREIRKAEERAAASLERSKLIDGRDFKPNRLDGPKERSERLRSFTLFDYPSNAVLMRG